MLQTIQMGGGNGNKAMLTRERNAKKAQAQKKGGVNQKEAAQKAMTLVCQICRTQFMNTCEEPFLVGGRSDFAVCSQ